MPMTDHTAVVGVFPDADLANRAVEKLHQADFREEQIVFVVRRDMFTANGISEEDAFYYQSALEANYTIVTVLAGTRARQVERVFHDHGAYDARIGVDMPRWSSVDTYPDDHGIQGVFVPQGTHR